MNDRARPPQPAVRDAPPQQGAAPEVSIVIPIYNEEAILHAAVVDLRTRLADADFDHELWLAENGSTDGTVEVAHGLCARYPNVHLLRTGEPSAVAP